MANLDRGVVLLAGRPFADEAWRVDRLLAGLTERAIECSLLCAGWKRRPPTRGGLSVDSWLDHRLLRPWAVRRAFSARPSLLHAIGIEQADTALALAEHWQLPYVLSVDEIPRSGSRLRVSRRWIRSIIAPTPAVKNDLERSMGVAPELMAVVPPIIMTGATAQPRRRAITVAGASASLEVGSGLVVLLDAARLVLDQGIDLELVISGSGAGEVVLRTLCENRGLAGRVTFAGPSPPYGPFWRVLDLYCQPATTPTSGLGLAQALALGIPSIATDVAGLRDLFRPNIEALRVPAGNKSALADALVRLIREPEAASAIGRAGQIAAERDRDPEHAIEQLIACYARAVESSSPLRSRRDRPAAAYQPNSGASDRAHAGSGASAAAVRAAGPDFNRPS